MFGLIDSPPRLPAAPGEAVYRSSRIEQVRPVGGLESRPGRLDWGTIPGAGRYELLLSGVDGEVLWSGSASAPPLDLPPEVKERMAPGGIYYWSVKAFDEVGVMTASSPPAPFWVEPDAEPDAAPTENP